MQFEYYSSVYRHTAGGIEFYSERQCLSQAYLAEAENRSLHPDDISNSGSNLSLSSNQMTHNPVSNQVSNPLTPIGANPEYELQQFYILVT